MPGFDYASLVLGTSDRPERSAFRGFSARFAGRILVGVSPKQIGPTRFAFLPHADRPGAPQTH